MIEFHLERQFQPEKIRFRQQSQRRVGAQPPLNFSSFVEQVHIAQNFLHEPLRFECKFQPKKIRFSQQSQRRVRAQPPLNFSPLVKQRAQRFGGDF